MQVVVSHTMALVSEFNRKKTDYKYIYAYLIGPPVTQAPQVLAPAHLNLNNTQ